MANSKLVLVTGVTGKQGGAVARALIAKGHRVRGMTRNVESDAARAVAALGVDLVTLFIIAASMIFGWIVVVYRLSETTLAFVSGPGEGTPPVPN